MPLRRWFTAHGLPAWWSWGVLVVLTAGSVGLNTVVSTRTAQRAVDADRTARQTAAEQSRGVVCLVVAKQEAVFREGRSEVERNAAQAWHDLGVIFGCYKE